MGGGVEVFQGLVEELRLGDVVGDAAEHLLRRLGRAPLGVLGQVAALQDDAGVVGEGYLGSTAGLAYSHRGYSQYSIGEEGERVRSIDKTPRCFWILSRDVER